jgi:hypothetical protein
MIAVDLRTRVAIAALSVFSLIPDVSLGQYQADRPYPEFMPMWREGWSWKDDKGEKVQYAYPGMPLGGYLFGHFRNSGSQPLKVKDVLLEGVSLAEGVAPEHKPKSDNPDDKYPSSLQFSKLPADQIARLTAAGEPVWWKVEPMVIPPGGYGQITVRLRRQPKVQKLTLTVPSLPEQDGKIETPVLTTRNPRFVSINFEPDFKAAYVYLWHPSYKGIRPKQILLEGEDVTANCTIVADERIDTVPIVVRPKSPFVEGTWYRFQSIYPDGTGATVSIGAWQPGFTYGMWGYSKVGKTEDDNRKFFLEDMRVHSINTLMYSISGEVKSYLATPEGKEYAEKTGIRLMATWYGGEVPPPFYYLPDEPDANDFASKRLDPYKRLGGLAQWIINRGEIIRRHDPKTPLLLNTDNTYKPENWYTYAQLADVPCADPYYQESVQSVLSGDPTNLGAYLKPTYVYAVGTIYQWAAAPRPMHLILHTCRLDIKDFPLRAPTPQEKRIEVFYAIAAGAKALSYWWYTPFGEFYGCGGSDPPSKAMWKEIGLLGAELRSLEPQIIRSCPAAINIEGPRMLWTRSLLVGDDAMLILAVNDNFACDRLGTIIKPVENAKLTVHLPSWLNATEVCEMTSAGTRDAKWQADAGVLTLDLGTVDVARLVLVSKTPEMRKQVQKLYDKKFAANVRALMTERSKR